MSCYKFIFAQNISMNIDLKLLFFILIIKKLLFLIINP